MRLYSDDEAPESSVLTAPSSSGIGIAPSGGGAPGGGGSAPREEIGFGQALYESFKPVAIAKAQRHRDREAQRQELTVGIAALKDGIELSLGVDGDQRTAFVKAYKAKLDKLDPELGAAFESLSANPETAGSIVQWGEESETLKRAIQAGGIKGAKKLLTSPEALKTIQAEIDTKRMPLLLRKGQTFVAGWQQLVPPEMAEQFNKDGRISASELITANEWIKANKPDVAKALAFTDRDLEVVGRNSEAFYHSLGIVSPKDEGAILVDKAKGENKGKPPPSRNEKRTVNGQVVDQPQEWDGSKWVDKGASTPHFKPADGEQRTVDVELKVSDDYARDSKKFPDMKAQFETSTEYMAKRTGANKTSAGDSALLYAYAKMRNPNDPRLAVQETTDLKKLGNIFERFQASVTGVLEKGETLPDRVAQEMYDEIRRSFTSLNRAQSKLEEQYRKKVKDYKGDPDRAIQRYALPEDDLNPKGGDKGANEPSQSDLEFTAKKHGISVEEVKRRLKAGKKK